MITRLTSPTALKPVGQEQGYVHSKVIGNVKHISISPAQI